MKDKVLVIEDEDDIRELLALHLAREGYQVDQAADGESALAKLDGGSYQLAIVDWMLPGISGLDICRKVIGRLPILMVTARAESTDIVRGLDAGADDYVVKPFDIPVVLARARALMRRARAEPGADSILEAGEIRVDTEKHEASCRGEAVALTASEFKLLRALLESRGRVLSRAALIRKVQGEGINVTDRTVDTHVFGLRKKLGRCGEALESVRAVGYRVRE